MTDLERMRADWELLYDNVANHPVNTEGWCFIVRLIASLERCVGWETTKDWHHARWQRRKAAGLTQ